MIAGHTVSNVDDMAGCGTKDRQLLELSIAYLFDVFITADKNLPFQQNISNYAILIVVLDTSNMRPRHILLLPSLMVKLSTQLDPVFNETLAIKINDRGRDYPNRSLTDRNLINCRGFFWSEERNCQPFFSTKLFMKLCINSALPV
jgi:hypothetical protein